ncbi:MAG TPA: EAL domain-containing protein [Steroidobacteraceae bacterium]|nr:EAL domain-containing protein [Steroidobacteraceae bacterium]
MRARVRGFFPLSITARLTLSFAAVTVLAATANLIAQKSVSVIRFAMPPETVAVNTPPPIALPPLPVEAPPPPVVKPVEPARVPIVDRRQVDALTLEIDQLERTAESRVASSAESGDEEFRTASRALRRAAGTFGHGPFGTAPAAAAVTRRASEYADGATELVATADAQRAARLDYARRSESIGNRLQSSLDAAWKIFGRVIARQSLVQLRSDFDALTHAAVALDGGMTLGADQLSLILDRERAFQKTLESNRAGLAKAEGAPWMQGMDDDFHALVDLRERIVALDARHQAARSAFSQQHVALSDSILTASTTLRTVAGRTAAPPSRAAAMPASSAPPSRAAATPASSAPPSRAAATPASSAPPPFSAAVTPSSAAATATSSPRATPALAPSGAGPTAAPAMAAMAGDVITETRGLDPRARLLMGAVTAAVMLIIAIISIITVRSVLKPVRRMIKATDELVHGERPVQVERGGVRELDALAGTFNDMAAKLAAARRANRHHQENLESTVLERTHKLQRLAQEDPLTSLPNRRHLTSLLSDSLERAAVEGRRVGVYFIDVDNFKNFNDSLGHAFGDRVLMSVANRLEEVTDGIGYVARLGGDEFTFIHEGTSSADDIKRVGETLVQAFHAVVGVDEHELRVSVSVGASIFPDHERTAEGLLRAADSALFHAKELGRNQCAIFTPQLTETAAARFTTEQGLRRALEQGEFMLVYQPEINLATLEVDLVEALLRWQIPGGRLVSPGEFLPVAEQSGLIADINAWVLHEAVRSAALWHSGGWPEARIAVNISSRQLLDHSFGEQLQTLLEEFQVPRRCIELELTESVLQTGPRTVAALRALKDGGFAIALDDFGTGYSSLTSLEQLPLSRIKLDRSLLEGVDSSPRAAAIVRAILDLCAGLGLAVTAEGIERPEQLAWLASGRDLYVQGYLLSKGLRFEDVLAARVRLTGVVQDLLLSAPAANAQAPALPPGVPALDEDRRVEDRHLRRASS